MPPVPLTMTAWKMFGTHAVYLDVDTSWCGFHFDAEGGEAGEGDGAAGAAGAMPHQNLVPQAVRKLPPPPEKVMRSSVNVAFPPSVFSASISEIFGVTHSNFS